ncbi:ATP-binding protein [Candidatus Margulisiibacteriota bacterium]
MRFELIKISPILFGFKTGFEPQIQQEVSNMLLKIILFAVPESLLISIFCSFILTRWVLNPISKLNKTAKALSTTDHKQFLPVVGSNDELDQLAETFNNNFRKIRDSYKRITLFTADASHELRLPITAIRGEAEVMLQKDRTIEEYRTVLANMVEEMDHMKKVLDRLLKLSRADSGEDPLDIKELNINKLVSKLIDYYQALAELKNIPLILSGSEKDIIIKGDREKLQELFSNLIENAIKYTNNNGKINLNIIIKKSFCEISIKDTGIGIPAKHLSSIFKRFYRVDKSRSRQEGGAGLGLSIAQMIAQAHNGKITVISELQKGSLFTVKLPYILT